jgi:hypothetical protein
LTLSMLSVFKSWHKTKVCQNLQLVRAASFNAS